MSKQYRQDQHYRTRLYRLDNRPFSVDRQCVGTFAGAINVGLLKGDRCALNTLRHANGRTENAVTRDENAVARDQRDIARDSMQHSAVHLGHGH
jgi:hypothetical protein